MTLLTACRVNTPRIAVDISFSLYRWPVVRYLLEDMQKNHTPWFKALFEITKIDPVKKEHFGNITEMVKDWIIWAQKNNLIISE